MTSKKSKSSIKKKKEICTEREVRTLATEKEDFGPQRECEFSSPEEVIKALKKAGKVDFRRVCEDLGLKEKIGDILEKNVLKSDMPNEKKNKMAMLILFSFGIGKMDIQFAGSGDSGSCEGVRLIFFEGSHVTIYGGSEPVISNEIIKIFPKILDHIAMREELCKSMGGYTFWRIIYDLAGDLVEYLPDFDWSNNDGGGGEIHLNIVEESILMSGFKYESVRTDMGDQTIESDWIGSSKKTIGKADKTKPPYPTEDIVEASSRGQREL